ncbi:hypothetical protein BLNAU_20773 [Blattamonas nauphoetae]|uniref:Protein kinase domain-containing protein n=1 Tax=Blattamonas nauphoetae TaxID=2049346 RepID=A0ABQ9WYD3_9EUKA|nr:hypothetical protein BLNAU_20773 [Blattamonas nauphoetae]
MLFICLLTVLLTISASYLQIPSTTVLPLESLIPQQRNTKIILTSKTKSEIVLPIGRYHVSNFDVTSTTLNLNGKQSSIFPSTTNDEAYSENSESNIFADEKEDKRNQLFRISNSTLWMSELTFECASAGSSIATICGSCVRIGVSRVISNSERTPLVIVGGDSGKSSSITIIACSHTSSCFPSLLPLTSLETSDSWMTHKQESHWIDTKVSVTGSKISVLDACLIGGSGALFDFCGLGQTLTDGCSISTTLSSSLLLNTTSSVGSVDVDVNEGERDFGNCWSVSQKMIGSCVSDSTNYLYGTGIRDLNSGGSILCSNTSFTHCTTTTEYSNQHFVEQTNISLANTLHLFSLCTFKECSTTNGGGGAIFLSSIAAAVEIDSCSFDSCSSWLGGAVYFYQPKVLSLSLTISSSSFVKCSSNNNAGGSLFLLEIHTLSISDCVFLDSQTSAFGGAVCISGWDAELSNTGLSNCLFENCSTNMSSSTGGGGALAFDECSSVQFDSLQFRECVAATGNGHDVYCRLTFPGVTLSTTSNCDSTSTPKAERIYPTTSTVGAILPDPSETATILSLDYEHESTTGVIAAKLNKEVTGSLLVLVSNSEGSAQPAGTAPNIGRVLLFSIESSTLGICAVSVGDTGLLQLPLEDYKIVTSSFSKWIVECPTLTSAECVLDETNTRALLILEGSDLEDETFELTLQDDWIFEARFSENKATIDLGAIGVNSRWKETQLFVIMSGKKKVEESIVVLIPLPLSFTIPLAARLTNIEVSELKETQTAVTLSFSSRLLKANQEYEITIEPKDGSERVVMSVTTDNDVLIADQTVKLYPSNGNEEGWKNLIGFGEENEVIGISAKPGDTKYPIQFSSITITTPEEPARVINAGCSTDQPATTIVRIVGSRLIEHETYTLTLSGKPSTDPDSLDVHDTTISVMASSSTEAKSPSLPLSESSSSSLLFGHTYTITAITNGSVTGIVVGTPSFTIRSAPSQPSLTSISCDLKEGDPKAVELSISGSNMPNGEYRLILKNKVSTKETVLKIEIVNSEGRMEIDVFSSSTLEYGAMYEVVSLWSSSVTVALPTDATKRLLEVPEAPARVRSVSCVLAEDLKTHVEVVICGENLPVGEALTVKVKEVDSLGTTTGSEIDIPSTSIASKTSTEGISIEVYEVTSPSLKFGKTYEVSSLTISGTDPFILDDSVRFSVPCEPVRVTSALCTRKDADRVIVSLEGSGFVLGEFYTVLVSGHPIGSPSTPSSSLHNTSFVVIASSSKNAMSSTLQLHPSEGSELKFSYSYRIVGMTNGTEDEDGVIEGGEFETQANIKRDEALITKIEVDSANSLNTSVVIEVSGTNLPSETVGKLTMDASYSFDLSFTSSSFGRSAVIELGVNGSLGFGSEFEITSLTDSNKQPIQIPETTLTTPLKPTKLSLCVCGNEEKAGLEMSGADPETCNSIKAVWNTATSLGILDTTMRIVDSADLSSPLIVTTRVPFNLISFQMEPATLRTSPSSSQSSSVLVSVEEGGLCRLTLLTITADLSVSTFRLVSASKGTVVLQYCSIEGTRPSKSNSEDGSICGWSRGLLELIETDTELNGVTMKEIEVGGIWMKGGKLKVTAGVFSQNGPSLANFTSARQNIHCEGEGTISIDKQTIAETDSMWIDANECSIDGRESLIASPLFVPTLSSDESTVETDKSGKQTVKVVGTTLMPCGLSLEVFEWDSSKNIEGNSVIVDLSPSTATHWNETEITLPFSESEVAKLNRKMEWRGRLVFGNGERTSNWMVVSGLISGNKSLGGTESKWWIPVIISLSCALLVSLVIVVCVCLLRKRHLTRKEHLSNEEMVPAQVEFDEKMEENDSITNPPNSAISSLPSENSKHATLFGETRFASEEVIPPVQSCVEVIVCNENMERSVAVETDTLFNALHNPHTTRCVEKRKVGQAIARGLVSLVEMNVIADVLSRLSPHWVLFDKNDRVSLKTRENQSVIVGGSVIGEGGRKTSEDGQRWMAPEVLQENWKPTKENADHGAVFSLGLVLWEIETGSVPFGEVDGATAQRRLASSEKPRMEKVSESMEAIIVPCLSLDPSQRPTLKTVLSQLDALNSVPQPSNGKEGNVMSKIG